MSVTQHQLQTTLKNLVAIPSVTNDAIACNEIIEYIRFELQSLGLFIKSDLDRPNPWLLVTTQDSLTPDVLLTAHVDVVEASPELFILQKQNGNLYGRGAYDMKCAAACYIELFKTHSAALHTYNLGLLFTTDEEIGGPCMPEIMELGLRPNVVFLPDGGDNWKIEKRAKGLRWIQFTSKGKAAHSSRPWEGTNALYPMLDVLQALRLQYPSDDRLGEILSVGTIQAGSATNQLPDAAIATVDFRSFSQQKIDEFVNYSKQLARQYGLTAEVISFCNPQHFDETDPRVQSFLTALHQHTGKRPAFSESYASSDARYFSQYDIPVIIVEPTGGGRHADNEHVHADDLHTYCGLLERWLFNNRS